MDGLLLYTKPWWFVRDTIVNQSTTWQWVVNKTNKDAGFTYDPHGHRSGKHLWCLFLALVGMDQSGHSVHTDTQESTNRSTVQNSLNRKTQNPRKPISLTLFQWTTIPHSSVTQTHQIKILSEGTTHNQSEISLTLSSQPITAQSGVQTSGQTSLVTISHTEMSPDEPKRSLKGHSGSTHAARNQSSLGG